MIFSDYIMAFIVGGAELDGGTRRLAFARYIPFMTKTILPSYMNYLAGAQAEGDNGRSVYGRSMYRRKAETNKDYMSGRNPFKRE
mgnify:CR=1 FL=1